MRQIIQNKVLPIFILIVVFITAVSTCFMHVHAGGSFVDNSDAWSNTNNSITASANDTYPYNDSSVSKTSVALDILYGTSKGFGLVQYHGEVPYTQVYDGDSNKADGFGNKYARPGTTISGTNPDGVDAIDYWGFDSSSSGFDSGSGKANLSDYESVNDSEIVSLRFYALQNTTGGLFGSIGQFFSNLLYSIGVGLAGLATSIISLIVSAKNIDMDEIMAMLNLQDVADVITSSFIFDNDAGLSPFALFAIIMFIFAVVGCGVRYAKGSDKKTGLKDLIITALMGLIIIGMCLSGKIVTLGSSAADLANSLMGAVASVATGGSSDGNAFTNQITDNTHTNKVAQLSEMSMINKIFIDMQICSQFGVSDIGQLKTDKFGDSSGSIANNVFSNYFGSGVTMQSDFNNNLGYYFWFANSSATQKTQLNTTFPTSGAKATDEKLGAMITYLQKCYNSASSSQKEHIINIIQHFATPNGASGCLSLLLLTAILVVMGICLFKYCLAVMLGKLELFLSILGLAVAGPLMLTTNKKLVDTGRAIVGMLPVAFIEITVYSIIFDLIIYLVASLMSTNILRLLVVLFLLLLLMKLNPVIQEKIRQLLDRTTRVISPALSDTRRAIKTYTRQKASDAINRYDKSKKVVGYDKDGNEITQERGGNALSKLMHQGYNTIYNDGMQREGMRKINRQQREIHHQNVKRSMEEKRKDAEARIEAVVENIEKDAEALKNKTEAAAYEYQQEQYNINGDDIIYNEENLTDEEKANLHKIKVLEAEIEAIKAGKNYTRLMAEKNHIDAENAKHEGEDGYEVIVMDEERQKKLDDYLAQIEAKLKELEKENNELKTTVDARIMLYAFDKIGLDSDIEGKDYLEKLDNATKIKAQEEHKEELETALQDGINTLKEEVNTKQSAKIGSTTATVNRDAITSSAAMMYQLKELQEGEIISDKYKAEREVKDMVDIIVRHNDSHNYSDRVDKAKNEVERAYDKHNRDTKDFDRNSMSKIKADDNFENAIEEEKTEKQLGKDNYKQSKEEHDRIFSKSTINDQLETIVGQSKIKKDKSNKLAEAAINKANENNNSGGDNSTAQDKPTTERDRWKEIAATDKEEATNKIQKSTQSQETTHEQVETQVQSQPKPVVQQQNQSWDKINNTENVSKNNNTTNKENSSDIKQKDSIVAIVNDKAKIDRKTEDKPMTRAEQLKQESEAIKAHDNDVDTLADKIEMKQQEQTSSTTKPITQNANKTSQSSSKIGSQENIENKKLEENDNNINSKEPDNKDSIEKAVSEYEKSKSTEKPQIKLNTQPSIKSEKSAVDKVDTKSDKTSEDAIEEKVVEQPQTASTAKPMSIDNKTKSKQQIKINSSQTNNQSEQPKKSTENKDSIADAVDAYTKAQQPQVQQKEQAKVQSNTTTNTQPKPVQNKPQSNQQTQTKQQNVEQPNNKSTQQSYQEQNNKSVQPQQPTPQQQTIEEMVKNKNVANNVAKSNEPPIKTDNTSAFNSKSVQTPTKDVQQPIPEVKPAPQPIVQPTAPPPISKPEVKPAPQVASKVQPNIQSNSMPVQPTTKVTPQPKETIAEAVQRYTEKPVVEKPAIEKPESIIKDTKTEEHKQRVKLDVMGSKNSTVESAISKPKVDIESISSTHESLSDYLRDEEIDTKLREDLKNDKLD